MWIPDAKGRQPTSQGVTSETGQALAQWPSLALTYGDLGRCRVGHDKQEAALEVWLDFLDPVHMVPGSIAARTVRTRRRTLIAVPEANPIRLAARKGSMVFGPAHIEACTRLPKDTAG